MSDSDARLRDGAEALFDERMLDTRYAVLLHARATRADGMPTTASFAMLTASSPGPSASRASSAESPSTASGGTIAFATAVE